MTFRVVALSSAIKIPLDMLAHRDEYTNTDTSSYDSVGCSDRNRVFPVLQPRAKSQAFCRASDNRDRSNRGAQKRIVGENEVAHLITQQTIPVLSESYSVEADSSGG